MEAGPLRKIVGFHLDAEQHWVAQLECGHSRHVRHDPPWQVRPWVTTAEGRRGFLGTTLSCVACAALVNDARNDTAEREGG